MPPTFPIFLGLMSYTALTGISLILFAPLLFFKAKRAMAMKVIATALISFPCLILVVIVFGLIFTIPALIFSGLARSGNISETSGIIIFMIGAVIFLTLVITSSLYLWFFISKVLYKKIGKEPASEFINNDRVFNILRFYLNKYLTKK